MGFSPGGEFKAAVEEGRKIGAKILLGDRDVDATLAALYTSIVSTTPQQLDGLNARLNELLQGTGGEGRDFLGPGTAGEISKSEITSFMEKIKTRDNITKMTNAMKAEAPMIYRALIGDRDAFMAEAIAGSDFNNLVGVVGFAHVVGIEAKMGALGWKLVKRNCPI